MSLNANELNYLVYRYLLEQNYEHSAFAFYSEVDIPELNIDPLLVPKGLLVALMQKAMQILDIEMHVDSKGQLHPCTKPFSLFEPHNCTTAAIINETITRYYPQTIEKLDDAESRIDDLPEPILLDQQKLINQLYVPPKEVNQEFKEEITEALQERYEESNTEKGDYEEKEDFNTKYEPELHISHDSVLYLLNKLENPSFSSKESFEEFERSVQLEQSEKLGNLLDEQQYLVEFNVFLEPFESRVSCIKMIELRNLLKITSIGQFKCICNNIVCKCDREMKDSDAVAIENSDELKLIIAGDESGCLSFCIFNEQKQYISQEIPCESGASIIEIFPLFHENRVMSVSEDGFINIFRINVDAGKELQINCIKIFSGYPCGLFSVQKAIMPMGGDMEHTLIVVGETAAPIELNLQDLTVSRVFIQTNDDDSIEMLGCGNKNSYFVDKPEIVDICTNQEYIVCVDSTNRLLITALNGSEIAEVIKLNTAIVKLFFYNSLLYAFSHEKLAFEINLETQKIQRIEFDSLVIDVAVCQQGIAVLTEGHVVLFGDIHDEEPIIKLDWLINAPCQELLEYGDNLIVFSGKNIIMIDPKVENTTTEGVFEEGNVTCLDGCLDEYCAGNDYGCVEIHIKWNLNE